MNKTFDRVKNCIQKNIGNDTTQMPTNLVTGIRCQKEFRTAEFKKQVFILL